MRGVAALCVFAEHFLIPFWGGIYYAYGFRDRTIDSETQASYSNTSLMQLSGVRLLFNGSPMVCIFFVISGTVLSIKPVRLMREREWETAHGVVGSLVFRRGIRLFGPAVLASFLTMVAIHLGIFDHLQLSRVEWQGPPEMRETFWEKQPICLPSFWGQLKEWFDFLLADVLIPKTWRGTNSGNDYGDTREVQYGSQFWTVAIEYWASILLCAFQAGTMKLPTLSRLVLLGGMIVFSLLVGRWDMALFLYGMGLAHEPNLGYTPNDKRTKSWSKNFAFLVLFCVGIHIASFPELGGSRTPGFRWLAQLVSHSRIWQSVGAALIVQSVCNLAILQRVFCLPTLLYFGRISYSLYTLHIPLLLAGGWSLVPALWKLSGQETSVRECAALAVAFMLVLVVLVWTADLYCRFVDEPCIRLARRVERLVNVKD
ncbi:acyltransferase 3 [Xylariaceae sp. FL1272]|nr:acyltransferase 3 [Xylariaceae sp. FL1272]